MQAHSCALCESSDIEFFHFQKQHQRDFFHCKICDLVFVNRSSLLTNRIEKERYESHENHIRSAGYEKFLRRVINPVSKLVTRNSFGLDYGEGPYPMLREIMSEDGFSNLHGYDPYFNKDESVFNTSYEFITCSEAIEHFNRPKESLEKMLSALLPSGYLAISTGIRDEVHQFSTWHYISDDTHINLFSFKTFEWIGKKYSLKIIERGKDLVVFHKDEGLL